MRLAKLTAIFVIATGLFMACNSGENKEAKSTDQATEHDAHHDHEGASTLALNNGAKWKADVNTNSNVATLDAIIAVTTPTTLEGYQTIGKGVQDGIDKMIKDCKMEGPDHDALHLWLEPLMEKNKELQKAKSIEEASKSFEMVKEQLNLYPQYFE